jgi:Tfp pilus assembly protein PilF
LPQAKKQPGAAASWGLLLCIVFAFAVAGNLLILRGSVLPLGLMLMLPILMIICLIGFVWIRDYDRDVRRALRRFQEGDQDGAIRELREVIDERGISPKRASGLGILLAQKSEWGEAEVLFRKALAQRPKDLNVRGNLGVMLWKQGRLEEAEPILRDVALTEPQQVVHLCNFCHVLVELGRIEEAATYFAHAEQALRSIVATPSIKSQFESIVNECRTRLANARGEKSAERLEEI